MQLAVLLDQRQQLALAPTKRVNLIKNEANFGGGVLKHLNRELILLIELASRVHDQQDKIAALQSFANFDHHFASERAVGFVNARGIEQYNLCASLPFALGNVYDALDSIARSLRFGGDDREFFAHERIE